MMDPRMTPGGVHSNPANVLHSSTIYASSPYAFPNFAPPHGFQPNQVNVLTGMASQQSQMPSNSQTVTSSSAAVSCHSSAIQYGTPQHQQQGSQHVQQQVQQQQNVQQIQQQQKGISGSQASSSNELQNQGPYFVQASSGGVQGVVAQVVQQQQQGSSGMAGQQANGAVGSSPAKKKRKKNPNPQPPDTKNDLKWLQFTNAKRRTRHYCCVRSCVITEHARKPDGGKYHFYRVPQKDLVRRQQWIRLLRPDDNTWNPALGTRVCEIHFDGGKPLKFGYPTLNLDDPVTGGPKPGPSLQASCLAAAVTQGPPLKPPPRQRQSKKNLANQQQGQGQQQQQNGSPGNLATGLPTQVVMDPSQLITAALAPNQALRFRGQQQQQQGQQQQHQQQQQPGQSQGQAYPSAEEAKMMDLAQQIRCFRGAMAQLRSRLVAYETEMRRICPDHPILVENLPPVDPAAAADDRILALLPPGAASFVESLAQAALAQQHQNIISGNLVAGEQRQSTKQHRQTPQGQQQQGQPQNQQQQQQQQ